jgi:replicative DNA helicase
MSQENNWIGRRERRAPELQTLEGGARREMPASEEAEQHVLGCCLLEESGLENLSRVQAAGVSPSAFYWPQHQVIFEAITELSRRTPPVRPTVTTVAEDLTTRKQFEQAGGFPFLIQISNKAPTALHLEFFLGKLRQCWILRELIREATGAVEEAYGYSGQWAGLEELLLPLAGRFNRAVEYLRAGEETMKTRAAKGLLRTLAKLDGKHDTSRQLFTGLREFDERFGAFDVFEEDFLIGIAALTSGGKSAFTRKVVDNNLRNGKRFAVFLLETTVAKWLDLAACMACRLNARMIHAFTADQKERFLAARRERESWVGTRLFIYDDCPRVETVVARVDELERQHGRLDGVVVDHLHELYSTEKFRGQREQELGYIAKYLKKSAKRQDTPYFVPTQLNRAPTKDGVFRRPTKHDLRGSGEIENAFDRVLLLHTPKEDMRGAEQTDNQSRVMIEIIQDKSRNGPIGHREFWFDRPFTDYLDIRDHELVRTAPSEGGGGTTKSQFKGERK